VVLAVNLKSVFLVTQAVLPGMQAAKWGRIINLSSVAAQTGGMVGPHYAASKAGIRGLTHSYATLLAKEGITVNAIAPALIETEMVRNNPRATPALIPVG
jgi:3-oxoacyl-[acyl-carrier protein] reductase